MSTEDAGLVGVLRVKVGVGRVVESRDPSRNSTGGAVEAGVALDLEHTNFELAALLREVASEQVSPSEDDVFDVLLLPEIVSVGETAKED